MNSDRDELDKFFNRFNKTYKSFIELTKVVDLSFIGNESECLKTLEMIDEKVDEYKENHIKGKDKKSIDVEKVLGSGWRNNKLI